MYVVADHLLCRSEFGHRISGVVFLGYAPILLSGCSSSAMYAMALSFITDVIGQEKVCTWLTIQQCDEIL